MGYSKGWILNSVKILCHVDSGSGVTQDIWVDVFRVEASFDFKFPEREDKDGNLYVRNATAYVLPKDVRDRLTEFDKKVEHSFQVRCPSYTDEAILEHTFIEGTLSTQEVDEWMGELKALENEYFQIRNEIVKQYDKLVAQFVSEFLNVYVPPHHRAETRAGFKKTIPSKVLYRSSFRIKLTQREPKEMGLMQ
ncbi:hypothetical protein LLE49_07305 [Alicyclobacillus tolerans]|uniref:hypothetical protein n=1 Tax=Alicyclobacillus tolerans TaxID=90970 RepID=UPI001F1C0948|nr:hypothetical protein [Alicyclobacillus tolerans]MCF8564551.1 hypothetical protein [Alicyclobacillus tolerans]